MDAFSTSSSQRNIPEEGEQVLPGDPRHGVISINAERLSGAAVFSGTRVPVQCLFDYLETGHTLNEFLDAFDGVSKEKAIAAMELASSHLGRARASCGAS